MKRGLVVFFIAAFCSDNALGQMALPEAVTNNAAVALVKEGRSCLYSFYGLDQTKRWPGMHNKVFRCDLEKGNCQLAGTVPDSLGRLASSASVIKNKGYVVGGYAVFMDGKEKSSSHIFEFDPEDESFRSKAALPVPIDDQVQGVWRDSLLYVISGWSHTMNVRNVQVFDPGHDRWIQATPLPDDLEAKVFGGSGIIEGDTIYLLGGATFGKNFPPSRGFYKGAINPRNPAEITWIAGSPYPGEFRYRSGCYARPGLIIFYGGSNETYNYNGISYGGKKPVEPNQYDLHYSIKTGKFALRKSDARLMDLRNIAVTKEGHHYILGGMKPGQQLSRQTMLVR